VVCPSGISQANVDIPALALHHVLVSSVIRNLILLDSRYLTSCGSIRTQTVLDRRKVLSTPSCSVTSIVNRCGVVPKT